MTLSPGGKVPVTPHDRGFPGAPVTVKVSLIAVPTVPEMAKDWFTRPVEGEAGLTPNVVAPATEL